MTPAQHCARAGTHRELHRLLEWLTAVSSRLSRASRNKVIKRWAETSATGEPGTGHRELATLAMKAHSFPPVPGSLLTSF